MATEIEFRSAQQIRRDFLTFFEQRDHRIVPSGPVFPSDDPTLLFTNAGMNQFKDVFLGTGSRDYKRAVDTQKCIRVSGKHNDLEEVGRDTYHHTFFEMLGNWSFGDYFKRDAIVWAWELLTKVWKLPEERLWITVFQGDEADGIAEDSEARRIWIEEAGVAPERVLPFDRRDNFWEMGEIGLCGPCSEIHIDRGGEGCNPADGADPEIGVNAGNERFIELWNLVFMEYNRLEDRSLQKLPRQHVDTGMGFERIASVLQGKSSNYDTDVFTPIFTRLTDLCGVPYTAADSESDVAYRVVADHVRAVSSAIADGASPSNTGRGYVLRRLIRRAARFGRQALGVEDPFLFEVAPVVGDLLGDVFPEISSRMEHIQLVLRQEEEAFGRTLGRGLVHFESLEKSTAAKTLPGAEAFELFATYGFPRDLVELMARERGLEVDSKGWDAAEEEHRAASRAKTKFKQLLSAEDVAGIPETQTTFHETGARGLELDSELLFTKALPEEEGRCVLVLSESPFYPEGGGQVGDVGLIEARDGSFSVAIDTTRKMGGIVIHMGQVTKGSPGTSAMPEPVRARVDIETREKIRKNHTATHLLHKTLREVLGDHVTQQGSYVGADRLRFDFSHPKGLTPEQVEEVERRVNRRVFTNASVSTTVEDLDGAKERGVTALFGEKYDERVRVVEVGDSLELCGGTHVGAAGDIGPFSILFERAIQAGVRRIEALTGGAAVDEMLRIKSELKGAARLLKTEPAMLQTSIKAQQQRLKDAEKQNKAKKSGDVGSAFESARAALKERSGIAAAVLDIPELDGKALGDVADRLAGSHENLCVVLFGRAGEKVPFLAVCRGEALKAGLAAGELAKVVAKEVGGGGGGRPDKAQGQGLRADALPDALKAAEELIAAKLGA